MKIYLDNNLGVTNVEQEELTQDTIGYNILKVYIPNAVLTPYDTFTCYYGALLQNGRKVGWFAMEARTNTDADYEENYTLYKATLEQCVVSVEGKVYIGCQILLGNSGNATLIKKNTAVVQFNVRKSVAINNDILVLDTDQTTTDVLESYKNLLENALTTYATKAEVYTQAQINALLLQKADKSDTYTKAQVDNRLSLKADKSDTYTKTESDDKFASKSNAVTHTGNQLQDSNGNNIYPTLEDKSITPEKLSVWGVGKNLFNKDNHDITYGYQLSVGSSAEYVNVNDYISNYIEVEASTNYVMRRCVIYAFYDENKTFISSTAGAGGSDSNITTFTTTATTKFVRFTGQISTISLIQLEKGTTPTPYENYKNVLDGNYLKDKSVNSDKLSFEFLVDGYNKYDSSKAIQGYQLTYGNSIYQNASKYYSDYIEVNENSYYSTNGVGVICYYDENKTFISGLNSTGNMASFKTPANTKYVRISGNLSQYNDRCFINKEYYTSYSDYKKIINPNFFDRDNVPSYAIDYNIEVNIPSTIIAVVGHQLNIYFENIIKCNTPINNFSITAVSDVGESLENCYRITPISSNVGTHTITLNIYDYNSLLIFKYQFTIKVIADATLDTQTNFVFIGDSNTNTNITYVKELKTMLGTNFNSIGTRSNNGVNHEGRGGWSTQNYVSNASVNGVTNAFWNPNTSKFDFSYWASTNNFSNISMVFITLGTNDRNTTNVVENLKEMINSIIDYDSNIKVFVSLVTPCAYSQYSERSAMESWVNVKNAYYDMMVKYLNNFDNQNNANIIPINVNLDCRNDYPESDVVISDRNPNTYKVITDRYHYSQYGQYKVADVFYNYIINEISE